jgi:hypothetical protein
MRRTPPRPTKLTGAVVLLVTATALAGCSGGGSSPSSSSSPAGGSSSSSSSSPTSGSTAVSAAALLSRASSASGQLKSAHLVVTSSDQGKKSVFTGDVSYNPLRFDLTVSGVGGKSLEERIIGDYAYIKVPGASSGKPWVKLNFAKVEKAMGLDLNSSLNNSNPGHVLELLEKSSDLKNVGSETVSGVQTTHLSGTVDVAKAYSTLTGQAKTDYEAMVKETGLKDEHIDMWVNGQQFPIKMVESYTDKTGPSTITVLLSKINQPVTVTAPPASEVGALP